MHGDECSEGGMREAEKGMAVAVDSCCMGIQTEEEWAAMSILDKNIGSCHPISTDSAAGGGWGW